MNNYARYQKIVFYNSIISFYVELNKNTEKTELKKMWKSGPTWIRTHDPLDQPDQAKRTIYSTILSSKMRRFFRPHYYIRKAISKALVWLSPH